MKDKNIQELIDLYHSGKLDIVKKKVVKLIEKYPNSFILYNLFGAVLTDQKNLNEAVINYRKSIQINPDFFSLSGKKKRKENLVFVGLIGSIVVITGIIASL